MVESFFAMFLFCFAVVIFRFFNFENDIILFFLSMFLFLSWIRVIIVEWLQNRRAMKMFEERRKKKRKRNNR